MYGRRDHYEHRDIQRNERQRRYDDHERQRGFGDHQRQREYEDHERQREYEDHERQRGFEDHERRRRYDDNERQVNERSRNRSSLNRDVRESDYHRNNYDLEDNTSQHDQQDHGYREDQYQMEDEIVNRRRGSVDARLTRHERPEWDTLEMDETEFERTEPRGRRNRRDRTFQNDRQNQRYTEDGIDRGRQDRVNRRDRENDEREYRRELRSENDHPSRRNYDGDQVYFTEPHHDKNDSGRGRIEDEVDRRRLIRHERTHGNEEFQFARPHLIDEAELEREDFDRIEHPSRQHLDMPRDGSSLRYPDDENNQQLRKPRFIEEEDFIDMRNRPETRRNDRRFIDELGHPQNDNGEVLTEILESQFVKANLSLLGKRVNDQQAHLEKTSERSRHGQQAQSRDRSPLNSRDQMIERSRNDGRMKMESRLRRTAPMRRLPPLRSTSQPSVNVGEELDVIHHHGLDPETDPAYEQVSDGEIDEDIDEGFDPIFEQNANQRRDPVFQNEFINPTLDLDPNEGPAFQQGFYEDVQQLFDVGVDEGLQEQDVMGMGSEHVQPMINLIENEPRFRGIQQMQSDPQPIFSELTDIVNEPQQMQFFGKFQHVPMVSGIAETSPNIGALQAGMSQIRSRPNIGGNVPGMARNFQGPGIGGIPPKPGNVGIPSRHGIGGTFQGPGIGGMPSRPSIGRIPPRSTIGSTFTGADIDGIGGSFAGQGIGGIPLRPNIGGNILRASIGGSFPGPGMRGNVPRPGIIPSRPNIGGSISGAGIGGSIAGQGIGGIPSRPNIGGNILRASIGGSFPGPGIGGNVPRPNFPGNLAQFQQRPNISGLHERHTTTGMTTRPDITSIASRPTNSGIPQRPTITGDFGRPNNPENSNNFTDPYPRSQSDMLHDEDPMDFMQMSANEDIELDSNNTHNMWPDQAMDEIQEYDNTQYEDTEESDYSFTPMNDNRKYAGGVNVGKKSKMKMNKRNSSTQFAKPEVKQVIKFHVSMKCPVCPHTQIFETETEFQEHWQMFHVKIREKNICPVGGCHAFASTSLKLREHYKREHHQGPEELSANDLQKLCLTKKQRVDNPLYRDPGSYVYGVKEEESKILFSAGMKCPVCLVSPTFGNVGAFHEHWQVFHIKYQKKFFCTSAGCNAVLPSLDKLKKHYWKEHNYGNDELTLAAMETLDEAKCKIMKNDIYVDPGKFVFDYFKPMEVEFVPGMTCPICPAEILHTLTEYHQHWQKIHVEFYEFLLCPSPGCDGFASKPHKLKTHYNKQHNPYSNPQALEKLKTAKKQLKPNIHYKDPGNCIFTTLQDGITHKFSFEVGLKCPACNHPKQYTIENEFFVHWFSHSKYFYKYACPWDECTITKSTIPKLKTHISKDHLSSAPVRGKMLEDVHSLKAVKVENPTFISDPGPYIYDRVLSRRTLDRNPDAQPSEDPGEKVEVTFVKGLKCPVCEGSKNYLKAFDFRNHWIMNHIEFYDRHFCPFENCNNPFASLIKLKHHYQKKHGEFSDGDDVDLMLEDVPLKKMKNPAYIPTKHFVFDYQNEDIRIQDIHQKPMAE